MEKKKLIGYYDYTVVLTYLGMLLAFTGILQVMDGEFRKSLLCMMFAGICDMFDGAVASTKDRDGFEKHFGIQIDSMCDLISFGVLPAFFVYEICGRTIWVGAICAVYTLCGLIRLAYYNVQEFERQRTSNGPREYFLGLPITSSALLIPLCYLIYYYFNLPEIAMFPLALVVLGCGFVAGIDIKKPGKIGKAILIVIGLCELFGVLMLRGADVI